MKAKRVSKYVCIHGHFYQPPRENPWLELVEAQDSAAPCHDWNERVCEECYAPNAAARILGPGGTIAAIVNNYERISFNFGPTLLVWLEKYAPATYQAILEADRLSLARLGHGNAMAQVYNHMIMPLATSQDKRTQVRWGVRDFERRFGRRPEGMWLAEAAVDLESLAVMAQEGIRFTILSPGQAQAVRPLGDGAWQDVSGGRVDPKRPYQVSLPQGGSMAVFFYDGPMSRSVAFEHVLDDGAGLARRLSGLFGPAGPEPQLVCMATDGESYGHHHRFGEMALAYALKALDDDPELELVNFAAYLDIAPPAWEARIVERSSWSCPHGVERWRADCGCAVDPGRGWNQRWRAPLRQGLDKLRQRLDELFAGLGGELLKDPWAARDQYVDLLGSPSHQERSAFLARHQAQALGPGQAVQAFKLLESQFWGMYMFTSCGWFFDDISGIEPVQNLRFAARALQLAQDLDGGGWEEGLLEDLAQAQSNLPREGNGVAIWRREVEPSRVGPQRVVAHAVISGVMGQEPPPERLYCFTLDTKSYRHRHELGLHLAWGRVTVTHVRLSEPHPLAFAVLYGGGHDFKALVGPAEEARGLEGLGERVEQPLRLLEQRALWDILQESLAGKVYGMADLFLEGRRTLAQDLLERTMVEYRETAYGLYLSNRETMLFLREINVPLPQVFSALAEAILGDELTRLLDDSPAGALPRHLGEVAMQVKALGLSLESHALRQRLDRFLTRDLEHLAAQPRDEEALLHAEGLLNLGQALSLPLDLWGPQNQFYRLVQERTAQGLPPRLIELGRRLRFDL